MNDYKEKMTYERIAYLKFRKKVPTQELLRRYPDSRRVQEIAMLDIPDDLLKKIVAEEKEFNRLMRLKERFARFI